MIRIRGLVKTSQVVRSRLKAGIPASEVAEFKQFVTQSIETVERLCAQAHMTPDQLPTPSRKAYQFLKQLHLNTLPVTDGRGPSRRERTISLRNITRHQRATLWTISKLARNAAADDAGREEVSRTLGQSVATIEQACAQHGASPAELTGPSRRVYTWMKFLTDERHLRLHLQATHRAMQLAEKVLRSQPNAPGNAAIQFTNIAGLYKSRRYRQTIVIQISEGFINASDRILKAIIASALLGKRQHFTRLIREYTASEEFSDVLIELDLMAETIAEQSKGKWHDLDEIFDVVNRAYFAGRLAKPRLTWGQRFTARKFAHYEPARDRVVVSLTLDDARIPRWVVEFVLYHELLHKKHGEKWVGGRVAVHTPEFRQDERKFKLYEEAQQWINKLASS